MPESNYTVLKFGGTSMGSTESLNQVIQIIMSKTQSHRSLVVVVSAMSKITDLLIILAQKAKLGQFDLETFTPLKERHSEILEHTDLDLLFIQLQDALNNLVYINEIPNKAYIDYISSFGERLSATLLSQLLSQRNQKTQYVDARDLIVTNDDFGNAKVDFKQSESKTQDYFSKNLANIYIVTGFIARSNTGATTTLGRGGSDYTGGLMANFLNANCVEIWTDVDGILSTDPRIETKAKIVNSLSYSEAFEVAYYGGKVLYPKTMEACLPKKIDIIVKNTFNPNASGTLVSVNSKPSLKVISRAKNVIIVEIVFAAITSEIGLLGKIFSWFAEFKLTLDVVTTSGDSVSFSCDIKPPDELVKKVENLIGSIKIWENQEIVALIGTDIINQPNYNEILQIMTSFKPKMISMNTKNTNLTVVVDTDIGDTVVKNVHQFIN